MARVIGENACTDQYPGMGGEWWSASPDAEQRLPDMQIAATATGKAKKSRHCSRDFFLAIRETQKR